MIWCLKVTEWEGYYLIQQYLHSKFLYSEKFSHNRNWTLFQISWNVKVVTNFPRQHSLMYFGVGHFATSKTNTDTDKPSYIHLYTIQNKNYISSSFGNWSQENGTLSTGKVISSGLITYYHIWKYSVILVPSMGINFHRAVYSTLLL